MLWWRFGEIRKKERRIKLNLKKNDKFIFGQHPLTEKSPPATDIRYTKYIDKYVYIQYIRVADKNLNIHFFDPPPPKIGLKYKSTGVCTTRYSH